MFKSDSCVLIIGVDDYSTYDKSQGLPEGTSALHGSVQDAKVLWRMCRELSIPPENMRILTSPMIDLALLDGATAENAGEATRANVLGGVKWLADRLSAPEHPMGVFAFSGHGDHTPEKGLVLCPSDVAGADLDRSVSFALLASALAGVSEQVTAILDCCHSGAGPSTLPRVRRDHSLRGRPLPAGVIEADRHFVGRVLAACGVGETTQQARFMGKWHGAFTWALGAALDQWKELPDAGGTRFDVSYGTALHAAKQLLASLSFEGTPVLLGPPGVEDLAVLQVGDSPLATSAAPDAPRADVQIDGGWNILIYDHSGGTLIAQIVTTPATSFTIDPPATNPNGYTANTSPPRSTEMWWVDSSQLGNLTGTIYITSTQFTGTSVTLQNSGFDPNNPAFTSAESVTWTSQVVSGSSVTAFRGTDSSSGNTLFFRTEVSNGSLHHAEWYLSASRAPSAVVPATGNWSSTTVPAATYEYAASH